MDSNRGTAGEGAEPSAAELLADVRSWRDRARGDRRGYAFPLFLFGALILLATVCYAPAAPLPAADFVLVPVDSGPFPQFTPNFAGKFAFPGLIGWYWVLTIVGGLALTGWWYRSRARRLGVETDTRLPLVVAGAALAGFLLTQPLLGTIVAEFSFTSLYSTPAVNLPILFGAAALSVGVLAWALRPQRTDRQWLAGLFAGALFASVAVASLGVYLIRGFAALLAIAIMLLVLAWVERSALLGAVGTLFAGSVLLVNLYDIESLGWPAGDLRLIVLQSLLLPAAILLGGGAVAALAGGGRK